MGVYFRSALTYFLLKCFSFKIQYNIKSTEIYDTINFNVSIHVAVGGTGSEIVVGIGVKVSQYFTITNVNTHALGLNHGIS